MLFSLLLFFAVLKSGALKFLAKPGSKTLNISLKNEKHMIVAVANLTTVRSHSSLVMFAFLNN